MRLYIVAFDISNNTNRRRIRNVLKQWEVQAQKSVILCAMSSWNAKEFFIQLGEHIDPKTDSLIMAPVDGRRRHHSAGIAPLDLGLMDFTRVE